jgi:phycocyanobilin lyase beta subunit
MTDITINQTAQLIEKVQKADSAQALLKAVKNLAEMRSPQAIPTLTEVLGFNNPGAAVAAVEGLINIGAATVPYLLANLDDYNYGARAWAIRVFAGIGDFRTLDLLLKAATNDFSLSVRRAATRGLGIIKWEQVASAEIDQAQTQVWEALCLTSHDGEWVVRYATVVALEALAKGIIDSKPDLHQNIKCQLTEIFNNDPEIVVRVRAQLAQTLI